nr:hypothetical protein [Herbaspirillum sp. ASV7]
MTNDEINVMVQELNFIIGVLRKVPDASSLANHSQELLSVEIQRKPRETMSPKGWGRLKALFSLDELFGEAYLQKISANGVIRNEDEYRKTLIELDILMQSAGDSGRQSEMESLIIHVNEVLAQSLFASPR